MITIVLKHVVDNDYESVYVEKAFEKKEKAEQFAKNRQNKFDELKKRLSTLKKERNNKEVEKEIEKIQDLLLKERLFFEKVFFEVCSNIEYVKN